MISSRPTIPLLVHEDCMGTISAGLAQQEANIAKTAENTNAILNRQQNIVSNTNQINSNTTKISSSIGQTTDASTSNTVIGLLKSIANKL